MLRGVLVLVRGRLGLLLGVLPGQGGLLVGLGLQGRPALLAHQGAADGVQLAYVVGDVRVAAVVEAELRRRAHRLVEVLAAEVLLRDDLRDGELVAVHVLLAATAVGDRVGQHDQRGGAGLLARGAQLDADAVPVGQPADHEQAHALRDRGVHGRRVGQLVVDVREVLGGQADALVVDLDHHAAVGETGRGDADLGLRGGERRRVLQQLGEQVHEVGDRAAVDLGLRDAGQLDALVLLHLGRGGAQDVDQRHRLVPAAAGLLAGEDEEVLAVAAHTGRQVVQLEEVLQLVRVGLVVLQVGDEGQLALDQRLVAAREVGEDRVDVAPQQGLLGGEPDGLAVDLVEGAGDLADLVRGGDRDGLDAGVDAAGVGAGELVDQHRQALLGDAEGGVAQLAHRAAHLAGDRAGQDEGEEQGDDDGGTGDVGVALGGVGDVRGLAHRLVRHVRLDLLVGVELEGVDRPPVLGGDAPLGEGGAGAGVRALQRREGRDHRLRLGGRRHVVRVLGLGLPGHRGAVGLQLRLGRLELGRVLLGTAADVLLDGDALEVGVRGQGDALAGQVAVVRARLDQDVHADGALQRQGRLGELDGVHGPAVAGDVAGAEAQLVGELRQRVRDLDVALFGLHTLELGGVRDLAQGRQLRLRLAEQLQPALQAGLGRHALGRGVEGVGRLVGGLADLGDGRLVLGGLGAALQQGRRRGVALVVEGVGVEQGGPDQTRGVLRVLGLLPGVDRALDLEAAHDEADQHGYEQDRVEPGRHAPVARGETAAARGGRGRRLRTGHGGGRRCARRRGEVAPGRRLGTVLASPHSTNNLSAVGTNVVPQCLRAQPRPRRTSTSLTIGQFRHSSTTTCALPNSRGQGFRRV